jgi:hypothetical protein
MLSGTSDTEATLAVPQHMLMAALSKFVSKLLLLFLFFFLIKYSLIFYKLSLHVKQ